MHHCHGNLSLWLRTHIIVMVTYFIADIDTAFVDLDNCSQLNLKFWTILDQCLSGLAPTAVLALTDTNTLRTRLTASQALRPLTPHLNASTATEWKHFVLSQGDWVTQIYLPDMFYPMEGTFALPLVIMDCALNQLVDPDPMGKEPPSRSHDIHLHCPLVPRLTTPPDLREEINALLFSIGSVHVSSYLEVLGGALSHSHKVSQ